MWASGIRRIAASRPFSATAASIRPQCRTCNVGQRVGQHGRRPVVGGHSQGAVHAANNSGPCCVRRVAPAGDVESAEHGAGDGHGSGIAAERGQQGASKQQLLCER